MALPARKIEAELTGRGNGWTTLTDLRDNASIKGSYGIKTAGPTARVAGSGSLTFTMDNGARVALGYYTPGHANCRRGWALGIRIRFSVQDPSTSTWYVRFIGSITSITPKAGRYLERNCAVTATDWFDDAARQAISGLTVQIGQLSGTIFSLLLNSVKRTPNSSTVGAGRSTFAYALDTALDGKNSVLQEINKVTMSEFGMAYQKGDGSVVFESRFARINSVNKYTFDNSQDDLTVNFTVGSVISRVRVTDHPKSIDAAATTVLYSLTIPVSSPIAAGATQVFNATYRDPNQTAVNVGGTSMVIPLVANTDYTGNTAANGLGSDMTGSLTVVAVDNGTSATISVTNNVTIHAATPIYLTKLQIRGKGIYSYAPVVSDVSDTTISDGTGETIVEVDQPYQSDPTVGAQLATYLLELWKQREIDPWSLGVAGMSELGVTTQLAYYVNSTPSVIKLNGGDATRLTQMLNLDIGDRIGVIEDVTGTSTTSGGVAGRLGFYVQSVDFSFGADELPTMSFGLTPADTQTVWSLGVAGLSELNLTTRLSF